MSIAIEIMRKVLIQINKEEQQRNEMSEFKYCIFHGICPFCGEFLVLKFRTSSIGTDKGMGYVTCLNNHKLINPLGNDVSNPSLDEYHGNPLHPNKDIRWFREQI